MLKLPRFMLKYIVFLNQTQIIVCGLMSFLSMAVKMNYQVVSSVSPDVDSNSAVSLRFTMQLCRAACQLGRTLQWINYLYIGPCLDRTAAPSASNI